MFFLNWHSKKKHSGLKLRVNSFYEISDYVCRNESHFLIVS